VSLKSSLKIVPFSTIAQCLSIIIAGAAVYTSINQSKIDKENAALDRSQSIIAEYTSSGLIDWRISLDKAFKLAKEEIEYDFEGDMSYVIYNGMVIERYGIESEINKAELYFTNAYNCIKSGSCDRKSLVEFLCPDVEYFFYSLLYYIGPTKQFRGDTRAINDFALELCNFKQRFAG
jgi:hypothetical protein